MVKFLIFSFSISLLLTTVKAQAQGRNIKINGFVDTSIIHKYNCYELTIRVRETANRNNIGKVIRTPITSEGTFKTVIDFTDSLAYFSFEFQDNTISIATGSLFNVSEPERVGSLSELYLFQKSDSIFVEMRGKGKLHFSGRGSEKLNCQWQIYNIKPLSEPIEERSFELMDKGKIEDALILKSTALKSAINFRLSILESYKCSLNKEVFNLLYLDAISSAQHQMYFDLPNVCSRFPQKKDRDVIKRYFDSILDSNLYYGNNSSVQAISGYYSNMLFEKETTFLKLHDSTWVYNLAPSFKGVYQKLTTNYAGILRDKLLFICFESLIGKNSESSRFYLGDAFKAMQDEKYKLLLKQLAQKHFSAYPFKLYDADNKVHRLNDYSGKILVIDFWFTGCIPCRMLSNAMHPIYQKFKDNKDVVFITVSTDPKNTWLKSIKSGYYTAPGMVDLHTNGEGFRNPLISHYNFRGFPQQLIINKKGELITSSPPRPDVSKANSQAFIDIINEALKL